MAPEGVEAELAERRVGWWGRPPALVYGQLPRRYTPHEQAVAVFGRCPIESERWEP